MTYAELEKLPAEAYLNPDNFKTAMDSLPEKGYAEKQYQHGLQVGREANLIWINARSVWGADLKNGGMCSSSEGIGYHSCTSDLLRGFLDSGTPIQVSRWNGDNYVETRIK